ncbi:MAG: hypothetical protein ACI90C_000910 [Rhodoferax sp.]|jgi:hypothetical protein
MINGNTEIIAYIDFPIHPFKAPMSYNPWFEKVGVNAIVVPLDCQAPDYPDFYPMTHQAVAREVILDRWQKFSIYDIDFCPFPRSIWRRRSWPTYLILVKAGEVEFVESARLPP